MTLILTISLINLFEHLTAVSSLLLKLQCDPTSGSVWLVAR